MKKFILPLMALIILSSCSSDDDTPQVIEPLVITKADFEANYNVGGETFIFFETEPSSISIPVAGEDQTWDFSESNELASAVFGGSDYFVPSNSAFPSATYFQQRLGAYGIGSALSNTYEAEFYYELNDNGIFELGQSQTQLAILNIPAIGAVLNYEAQNRAHTGTPRLPSVLFPVEYGDTPITTSGTIDAISFTADAAAFGLNNTPGQLVYTDDVTQEVIASGIANFKGIGNKRVLVTKTEATTTVNYFLGGAPAPAALLSMLGATDGSMTTVTTYRFIAEGLGTSGFIDVDESGAIISARFRKG